MDKIVRISANTNVESSKVEYGNLKITPSEIHVLGGDLGKPSVNIKDEFKNYMSLCTSAKDEGLCIVEWD